MMDRHTSLPALVGLAALTRCSAVLFEDTRRKLTSECGREKPVVGGCPTGAAGLADAAVRGDLKGGLADEFTAGQPLGPRITRRSRGATGLPVR